MKITKAETALDQALALLAAGLWPVPITAIDDRSSKSPGKAPIGAEWGKERHTAKSLKRLFAEHAGAGVGLKLGPEAGVIDLDCDDPATGDKTIGRIFRGEVPETVGWSSTRGSHLLYLWDERLAQYRKAIVKNHPSYPGLELRFGWSAQEKQYQSVVPPSLGGDGHARAWNEFDEIRPLPECFFVDLDQYLIEPERADRRMAPRTLTTNIETRVVAYLDKCQPAISGQRGHDQAFKVACKVGPGFDLAPEVAYRLIGEQFNVRCEPPWSEKELRHKISEAYKVETRRGWLIGANGTNGKHKEVKLHAAGEDSVGEADDDPHRLARLYLEQIADPQGPTLRYWLEEWHRWDGARYRVISDSEIRADLVHVTKTEFDRIARADKDTAKAVSMRVVSNALQALAGLCLLRAEACPSQPAWLGYTDEDLPNPVEVLPATNGLVHLPALVEGRECLIDPTPLFFSPNSLGYEFDANAPPPEAWTTFLSSLWPDDSESIESLQEWMGYLLVPDTSQQKILMIVGPKRSGKGTIARVIRAMVGPLNVASPTLSGLSLNFGLAPLIGKTVAIFADARLSGRADSQVIVERLLSISGEDAQTIDRKHLTAWHGTLPSRFVLISNELPRLGDSSGALPSRMMVLHLTRSFFGHEDIGLTGKLLAELPSILLWSIAGWARLRERGRFVQAQSGQVLTEELENLSNPIATFVAERCVLNRDHRVTTKELYDAWKEWCSENGRKEPGDAQGFGRNLRAAFPLLKTTQERTQGGLRHRVIDGIALVPTPVF